MKSLFKLLLLSFFAGLFVVACSDDDDDTGTDPADTEFVATDSDFADYSSWTELATNTGPQDFLGDAHGGTMSTRVIWANDDNISMENGEWPVGTILAKKMNNTETGDLMGVMAMVKRGADFDTDNNNWEWFKLNEDGTISERSGDGMNSDGCNGCHAKAPDNDYSFTLMNN